MLGSIQAGFPSPAEEELRDVISLDEYLITRPDASFLLKVTGDSMTGRHQGRGPGHRRERREPKNGDIVIAEVDGEWTMKYFTGKERQSFWKPPIQNIRPLNPDRNSVWAVSSPPSSVNTISRVFYRE